MLTSLRQPRAIVGILLLLVLSMLAVGTTPRSVASITATALGAFRRSMVVAVPVTTTCSSETAAAGAGSEEGTMSTGINIGAIEREMAPILAKHRNSIFMNEALYRRVAALYDKRESLGLDPLTGARASFLGFAPQLGFLFR